MLDTQNQGPAHGVRFSHEALDGDRAERVGVKTCEHSVADANGSSVTSLQAP